MKTRIFYLQKIHYPFKFLFQYHLFLRLYFMKEMNLLLQDNDFFINQKYFYEPWKVHHLLFYSNKFL